MNIERPTGRDSVTNLYTKEYARVLIRKELSDHMAEDGALIIMDIDDFSSVVETYGRIIADTVLQAVGERIELLFSKGITARYSSDIFVVYCQGDLQEITTRLEELREKITQEVILRDEGRVHISAGISVHPKDGVEYDTLYGHADLALWMAKRDGKNQIAVYQKKNHYESYLGQTYRKLAAEDKAKMIGEIRSIHIRKELFDFCFDILIREKDITRAVYLIFNEICLFFGLDRSVLLEKNRGSEQVNIVNVWSREEDGDDRQIIEQVSQYYWKSGSYPADGPDCYIQQHGKVSTADFSADIRQMKRPPATSVQYPIFDDNNLACFITYESWTEREFSQIEIATLTSITKMLSSYVLKFQVKVELEAEYSIGKLAMDVQKLIYYVINIKNFQIKYFSRFARELYPNVEYSRKCYEVLMNRTEPCDDCPVLECLEKRTKQHISEIYDNISDNWYTLTASLIEAPEEPGDVLVCKSNVTAFLQRVKGEDQLTGLLSYDKFRLEALKKMKCNDTHYALIFTGIQDFYRINDEYGYVAGDEVLKSFADTANGDLSEGELSCRIKGDDFVFLIAQETLERLTGRMRAYSDNLTMRFRTRYSGININCFGGIYLIPEKEESINKCIDKAMKARRMAQKNLYETNGVFTYSKQFELQEADRDKMSHIIEEALKKDRFCVYFQPKVDITDGTIMGAEALVRLLDADGKLIPPNKFIPLAEETGIVVEIDHFVYEKTFEYIRKWRKEGKKVPLISVNLSRLHLLDDRLPEKMEELCSSYELYPKCIELEITESVFFEDTERLIRMIRRLKEVGFIISMDDFGAGYSTLNFMKSLPVDIIKIDGGFFMRNELDNKNKAVISAIMQLSNNLDFKTVSEGVETNEQIEFIRGQGGKYVQGYYYYKPMPAEEFEKLLK